MSVPHGWRWLILMMLGAVFFLLFGIQLLVAAYALNDPVWFVMTFFSSSLIILISAAILFGLLFRVFHPQPPRSVEKGGGGEEARHDGQESGDSAGPGIL